MMRLDYPDKYLTVNQLRIRYWDVGQGETIVLLHGLGVTIESWGWNIESLSQKYRIIAFDLPGFGASERPKKKDFYEINSAATFIDNVLTALEVGPAHLVGNSLGGWLAIQFTLMFPDKVKTLILIDSAGLGKAIAVPARIASLWPLGELLLNPTPELIEQGGKITMYHKEYLSGEFLKRSIKWSLLPNTKRSLLWILRSGVSIWGQHKVFKAASLAKISIPTLVFWGKQDTVLPYHQMYYAVKHIPNAVGVLLEDAGHPAHIDRWETFNRLVPEFIQERKLLSLTQQTQNPDIYLT